MVPSRSALDHSLPANFTLLNGKAHISKTKRYQGTREYTAHSSKYIRRWQSPEKEIAISTMQNYSNYELNRCGKTNFRYLLPSIAYTSHWVLDFSRVCNHGE